MSNRKRNTQIILGTLLTFILITNLFPQKIEKHAFFNAFDNYPLVIAHAGSELFPTNTLYALERYADMGVDILEMDVHMTHDGEIVLLHDHTVDRTTDGSGTIWEMTYQEVADLDAAYNWTQDEGKTYPLRGTGIVIPKLKTVFETFPGYPMIIEVKQDDPSLAKPFCDMIKTYDMADKVIVASSRDEAMREFRTACPEVATSANTGEVRKFVILNFLGLAGLIDPEYVALHVPEESDGIPVVTGWFVWVAQRKNIEIHIWTINEPDDLQRFIDKGLDGIMTDRTDLMLEMLGRK